MEEALRPEKHAGGGRGCDGRGPGLASLFCGLWLSPQVTHQGGVCDEVVTSPVIKKKKKRKEKLLCACVDNKLSRERQNRESDVCCLEEWTGEHWVAGRFWAQCDGGKHGHGRPVG